MTVSNSTRLGLTYWSSDADQVTREQFQASHEALENFAVKMTVGTTLPTPAAEHEKSLFYKNDTQILYYYQGTGGSGTWVPVNNFGGTVQGLTFGGSTSSGSSTFAARADHTHAVPTAISNTIVDAKGDIIAATANDTVARIAVGIDGQVLGVNSSAPTGIAWQDPASTLIVSATMPVSPVEGDIWFDTTTGRQFVYYDSFFVEMGTASDLAADVIDAKGDLLVGTAANTLDRLPLGEDEQVLVVDSTQTTGVKWIDASIGFEKTFMMMGA
jgi:hypothetical protein